jgi:BirA family transcriptional regulator, biotin operon repressor / biotin---[acetyl-CoA-carboxylase] ligase
MQVNRPTRWSDLQRPPLRVASLRRAILGSAGPWTRLDVVAVTGSTNADLVARARAGAAGHGAVLTADHQHAGRGRRDRSWTTPPGAALAVSMLVRPEQVPPARWSWLPLVAGLGVLDALVGVAGVDARLKWPNDVLVDDAKVCGVLCEVVDRPDGPAVVVGVGINVSQTAEELPVPTATSLLLSGSAITDRDTVLRAVLRAFGDRYLAWVGARGDPRGSDIGAGYREACVSIGQRVRVDLPGGSELFGRAAEVDDEGRLVVDAGGVRHRLAAGDVVHVRSARGSDTA